MLPLHRTTSSSTFGANAPTINPRARGVMASVMSGGRYDDDDAKGMKKSAVVKGARSLATRWREITVAAIVFLALRFLLFSGSSKSSVANKATLVVDVSRFPSPPASSSSALVSPPSIPSSAVAAVASPTSTSSSTPPSPAAAGSPADPNSQQGQLPANAKEDKVEQKASPEKDATPSQQQPLSNSDAIQNSNAAASNAATSIDLSIWDDSRSLPLPVEKFTHHYPPFLASQKDLTQDHRKQIWEARAQAVKGAFSHAWDGYERFAWNADELKPISKTGDSWLNMGITILDALDTALVLKNETIFKKAAKWVIDGGLSMNADVNANVFETTIRVIGGLLSAHHLCDGPEKEGLLKQAVRVADKFMPAYETSKSGIPINSINLAKGIATSPGGQFSSTAEATTVQLELKYLSHLTGDPKYWNAAQKVSQVLYKGPQGDKTRPNDGLVPIYINPDTGDFVGSEFRLGSRADSYYEYLAKQYLQTNGTEPFFRDEYRFALHKGIKAHLLMRSAPSGLLYIRELMGPIHGEGARKVDKFDHLVCYVAGTMALAATKGKRVPLDPVERVKVLSGVEMEELYLAEELARSCYEMYRQTATGLASEIVFWRPAKDEVSTAKELDKTWARFEGKGNTGFPRALEGLKESKEGELLVDFDIHALDRHNLLRPEAVESFFVLWRITGDEKYREWGWRVFRSFEQWSKVPSGGYTSLNDVLIVPPPARDKMESFFLGETLKYFYLLFSEDSILPLDKYVFNTECHPLPIFEVTPEMRKKVIWMD